MTKEVAVDFSKYSDGLVPAVIQDSKTKVVLMLGFMNAEALKVTLLTKKVTFYSRSKKRIWTKGEVSGHNLLLDSITPDCDNDTLLIKATPIGPVCHTGSDTCWNEINIGEREEQEPEFLHYLESIIEKKKAADPKHSYTASLFHRGINKIAQKVGEEAVELVIEAKDNDQHLFLNEAADLLFHYLILLNVKGFNLQQVKDILKKRHSK